MQWWMRCCAVCVQGGGSHASIFRVKPSCRAEPGILRMCGMRSGIGSIVSVANFSCQGQRRNEWVGILFGVIIKHRADWVIFCEICLSEMSVWMHSDPGRACSAMRYCAVKQCLARWWRHLPSVCIARGLYLLRYSHRLNSDRVLPRRLRVCRCDTELWG